MPSTRSALDMIAALDFLDAGTACRAVPDAVLSFPFGKGHGPTGDGVTVLSAGQVRMAERAACSADSCCADGTALDLLFCRDAEYSVTVWGWAALELV